ncbi:MAG: zinc ribbon domain-containing protein [Ruminococcus sp.]|nr:zinc ribbon domain-containing protein [Ruminococcus sp.]
MYCANCGARLDEGNFCPRCGAPVIEYREPVKLVENSDPSFAATSLPEGIICDENGVIRWAWQERNYTHWFFMDEKRAGMRSVPVVKEETVGSAFKDMMKSGFELALSGIVRSSDCYNGQELPWESNGDGSGCLFLAFSSVKKIKGNPDKNEIRLKDILSNITLRVSAAQYPFVLDYVIRHAPQAKVK